MPVISSSQNIWYVFPDPVHIIDVINKPAFIIESTNKRTGFFNELFSFLEFSWNEYCKKSTQERSKENFEDTIYFQILLYAPIVWMVIFCIWYSQRRVERRHAPAESRRLWLRGQCRGSNDFVSDARVSARSVFIFDEKQSRESGPCAQLAVSDARSASLTTEITREAKPNRVN